MIDTPTTAKHLWEVKHRYYCNEGNYFSSDPSLGPRYKAFADFMEEWGDADPDYNLIFRWDWVEGEDAGYAPSSRTDEILSSPGMWQIRDATHWMPLPTPPEGGEHG